MPHRDIENMSLLTKISFILSAIVVGIVHFGKRDLKEKKLYQKMFLFIYDCATAGSISVFSGLVVLGYTDNVVISLGVGGILGHLGNRWLNIIEKALKSKLNVKD